MSRLGRSRTRALHLNRHSDCRRCPRRHIVMEIDKGLRDGGVWIGIMAGLRATKRRGRIRRTAPAGFTPWRPNVHAYPHNWRRRLQKSDCGGQSVWRSRPSPTLLVVNATDHGGHRDHRRGATQWRAGFDGSLSVGGVFDHDRSAIFVSRCPLAVG